jgi:hypothetical protein
VGTWAVSAAELSPAEFASLLRGLELANTLQDEMQRRLGRVPGCVNRRWGSRLVQPLLQVCVCELGFGERVHSPGVQTRDRLSLPPSGRITQKPWAALRHYGAGASTPHRLYGDTCLWRARDDVLLTAGVGFGSSGSACERRAPRRLKGAAAHPGRMGSRCAAAWDGSKTACWAGSKYGLGRRKIGE